MDKLHFINYVLCYEKRMKKKRKVIDEYVFSCFHTAISTFLILAVTKMIERKRITSEIIKGKFCCVIKGKR